MSGFSFKHMITSFGLLISALVWLSSTETCNAMYKYKGKHHGSRGGPKFNVLNYGAKGDGNSDDIQAFQAAWADVCKADSSTMIVPSGFKFLVGPISFSGSNCSNKHMIFQLDGTILAPTNSKAWGSGLGQWLEFTEVVGFRIKGKGTIDGRGSVWWTKSMLDSVDNNDKLVSLNNTTKTEDQQVSSALDEIMPQTRPVVRIKYKGKMGGLGKHVKTGGQALRFDGGSDVTVTGITIQNSPQFHLTFNNCDGVTVFNIRISSPGDSPNTDGIHLSSSKSVIIHHVDLACGDDCISIQTGCKDVVVHDVNCGPGHGISIGSLGIDGTTACVSNIIVKNVKIHNTMTGVRIKTWQGAVGMVRGVVFTNIQVSQVEVPIMIDQYYCDHSTCKNQTSAVSIANIAYENIWGTYTVQPVDLSCSDSMPCMDLKLSDINLKPKANGHEMSQPFCWQAFGKLNSPIIPNIDCLQDQGNSSNNLDLDNYQCAL